MLQLLAALLLLLGLQALPGRAAESVMTATRIAGDETRTRFVADLSVAPGFTAYVLPDPYRVVIDIPNVRFELPRGLGNKTRGLISAYRFGEVDSGKSRIVIDTKGPVLIEKSFAVPPQAGQPARIVLDLVATTAEAFTATLKADEEETSAAIAAAEPPEAEPLSIPSPSATAPAVASGAPQPDGAVLPKRQRKLVVIDPGHGGIDPGAIGRNKTKEKDVVLAFGLKLREQLLRDGRYDVVMTRSGDEFISLKDRVRIARQREADLFIALHADTVRGAEARGATIYTLSEKASDAEAEALAHKENRADIIAGIDLGSEKEEVTDILIDLVQRESKSHALLFARKAVVALKPEIQFTGKPLRSAGFVVLKAPDVPSVLIELGYLSSTHDEQQLVSPAWQTRVATALAAGIDRYFETEVAARGD
ncbi:MAG: N-acetylmuramoyl-L-alanine amidase [Hyphomicrobiales bacterium]